MPTVKCTVTALKVSLVVALTTVLAGLAVAHEGHEVGAEPDVEIYLGEMYVRAADAEPGEPIHVEAGRLNLIRVTNEGEVEHELHFGRDGDPEPGLYLENLFGLQGEHAAHGFLGVVLAPGDSANLHVWIPADRTGEWEVGCFIPGHYQAGQKAPFIIE